VLDIGLHDTLAQDLNNNGIPDPWEYDTLKKLVSGLEDSDGDAQSDYEEYVAGTLPNEASSVFGFHALEPHTGAAMRLVWSVVPGRVYTLHALNLSTPAEGWLPVGGPWFPGPGENEMEYIFPAPAGEGTLFKIQVTLP